MEHDPDGEDRALEAEYNNRAKVPGHPAILAGWQADAAAFRAAWTEAETGIAYGSTERSKLDLFWPNERRDARIAMFIHGGYWQGLDRASFSHLARGLLAHGVAVAMPSYDLCPHVTMTIIVEQLRECAGFLARRHGAPVLAAGHSAGGHLAAMIMAADWKERGLATHPAPHALALSGLFDLLPLLRTSINRALQMDRATALSLSPACLPRPGGHIHAMVGGLEGREYERQAREIAAAWGGSSEVLAGHDHFTIVSELADPDSAVVLRAVDLMARTAG
ncbi:MAG: alpha/beta hydrolase [Rhodospirillales bacterium]|jgi:arylformamidase|nr:alpha/beta hydrolase [Rhodospirillales bacterium]